MTTPDLVNADFEARAVVTTGPEDWIASPQPGVERRLLDRIGGEVARATSLVRYAPGSRFPAHVHGGGEEYLVIEGVFSDENGDFPVGSYVRNPPGSRHAPHTEGGCTIFVKLRQMNKEDQKQVVINTNTDDGWTEAETGVRVRELFCAADGSERVQMVELAADAKISSAIVDGGEEMFVLVGSLRDEHGEYAAGTWIRNPSGFERELESPHGCRYWHKSDHLTTIVSS